jgi:prophage regulatory protein
MTDASTIPKLLTGKELRALIPYSEQHIRRLEKKGEFPRSVHLGPGRVVWVESEIVEWLEGRRTVPS